MNYEKLVDLDRKGRRTLHREGKSTVAVRYKRKLLGKSNWYKSGDEEAKSGTWEEPENRKKNTDRTIKKTNCLKDDPKALFFCRQNPRRETNLST